MLEMEPARALALQLLCTADGSALVVGVMDSGCVLSWQCGTLDGAPAAANACMVPARDSLPLKPPSALTGALLTLC